MENAKFIVFIPKLDFYIYPYYDLFNKSNVVVKHIEFQSINKALYRIRNNEFTGKFVPEITDIYWYKKVIDIDDSTDNIIFWFMGVHSIYSKMFRKYILSHFPNSKIVVTLFDLVRWYLKRTNNFLNVYDFADIIYTYDKDDANKYGLKFHRDAYSIQSKMLLKSDFTQSDINFCGKAKDRYRDILEIYDSAIANGLQCDFNVVGLPDEELVQRRDMEKPRFMPYLEYLQRIQKTNCLLELPQGDSTQYTLRPWEAIAYGKKVLTKNRELINEPFYDPKYIQVYESVEDIDWEWVKRREVVDYRYIETISVEKYMNDIYKDLGSLESN